MFNYRMILCPVQNNWWQAIDPVLWSANMTQDNCPVLRNHQVGPFTTPKT